MRSWKDLSKIAGLQHGCFSRRQATETGLDSKALQREVTRGTIILVHPTVFRVAAAPLTWHQRLMAATLSRPGAYASHRAAARLHGLDGFEADPTIEICFGRGTFHRLDGVAIHRWRRPSSRDLTVVDGVPTTSMAATLVQLGTVTPRRQLMAATLQALERGVHPLWIDQTMARMNRPGRTGLKQLRGVLADPVFQPVNYESVLELVVDRFASKAGLPPLARQIVVDTTDASYRLDLGYPAIKWGLEATSRKHHFGRMAEARDSVRHLRLAAAGWQIEYLTWWAARDPETYADLLVETVRTRCRTLGLDPSTLGGSSDWVNGMPPHTA